MQGYFLGKVLSFAIVQGFYGQLLFDIKREFIINNIRYNFEITHNNLQRTWVYLLLASFWAMSLLSSG